MLMFILCGAAILALQVILVQFFSEHQGTDDKSIELIQEIAPGYKPWASNIWEPQDDFSEKILFAVQASLGLGIIIFYILKQRRKSR